MNNKSINLAKKIKVFLDDAKAEEIKIIDIRNKASFADAFVIATCRSSRHANATADEIIKKLKKQGIFCKNPEGQPQCDWIIVDVGNVIIHLFRSEIREIYSLEKLWDISFDSLENRLA